ncbi:MAG: glycine cleavage system aminomethyltransferase GcvT [Anditalea sp.]
MEGMAKIIALNDVHVQMGAKMIPFAGFKMPVRYSSEIEEHKTVRKAVGIFDVSHMGEFIVKGPNALALIQWLTSNDASELEIGQAQYSCFPNEKGGIVDDLIVYKMAEEEYMLVVNASNTNKDWKWINLHNQVGAELENISDQISLFAVQGPKAAEALQSLTPVQLDEMEFYHFKVGEFAGIKDVVISATGYTGAGGFELFIKNEDALTVWNAIFEARKDLGIRPIGLGARDTLRLEMGYPLYGSDITEETSPIEAGLGWITKFTKDFINSANLKNQKENGVESKLVGFILREKGIPRAHYPIFNAHGDIIGKVTSGTLSPSMGIGIGLGYVETKYAEPGTHIAISVRNKSLGAVVEKLPLLKQ